MKLSSLKLPRYDKKSISGRIFKLIIYVLVPMLILSLFILLLMIFFYMQYSSVTSNITNASGFNQNFKDEIDLKMYYFVIGNTDELPWSEVRTARQLAKELQDNTENSDSKQAITRVLNLCDTLNANMVKIENTEGYDMRIEQLENNIYVITELLEEYIYTYMYYEAGELASLRDSLTKSLIVEVVLAVAIIILIGSLSSRNALQIYRSITDPLDALCSRVEDIGNGDLDQKKPVDADDMKLMKLSTGVEQMVSMLSGQIELNRQEQIRLRGIELSLIQAQINPHFLYNTLDTIVWLIETGKDQQAEEMVTSLSTYFRSFLSNGKDIITVNEELLHVRSYLEIQQVRYKDRLDYALNTDDSVGDCLIPKMTLQPIIENAIYHGIKPKRGKGVITVSSSIDYGVVTLRVEDTGIGMDSESLDDLREQVFSGEATGFGLVAAYKRLKLMHGVTCSFSIDSEAGVGTTITIRIPYRTESSNA